MDAAFARELDRFGPSSSYPPIEVAAARMYCAKLARSHYENFSVASVLLPRRLLRHFHAIYAYCRWADDLGDETGGGARSLALLRWWREELNSCFAGEPRHPVMVALRPTIDQFAIPKKPFLDLLFAFEQDQLVKRYRSFEQLQSYCNHSADPVGHLVLYLCQSYTPANRDLSNFICTGLQLANFWQDVARDLDIGRVYLPEEDMARFGYSQADLESRSYTPAFIELLSFEVRRAREYFQLGLPLVDRVAPEIRTDIELFARGGLAILSEIERQGYNVWKSRPKLSRWTKASLLLGTWLRRRV